MRKRIAVFAGGWAGDYVQEVLSGIIDVANRADMDVFVFINFSVQTDMAHINIPEINLFKLPDLSDFDGAIYLANSFNQQEEYEYLTVETVATGIPAVCVEYQMADLPLIATDNYSGMYDLADHMFSVHDVKEFLFIGGPETNPECMERVRALKDAAKKNHVEIPETSFFYADWGKNLVPGYIDQWVKLNGHFPEAVICANDIMALSACAYLRECGKSVPEEIYVTGYDCIRLGQERIPSITSVNHEWASMGTMAGKTLLSRMQGEEVSPVSMTTTRFVTGGTCGCGRVHLPNGNSLGRALTEKYMDPVDVDSHFRHFYSSIRKSRNRVEVHNSYNHMFKNEHTIEGDDFKLYLDPDFFNVTPNATNLLEKGHRESYDVLVNLQDGKEKALSRRSKAEAIFRTAIDKETPGYYLFLTLSTESRTLGFAMLNGPLNVANENQYYIWTRHMNQSLELVHNNLLMEKLQESLRKQSYTDPMTGVYNRGGCEQNTYPLLLDWTNAGGMSVIMLVDLDRMKTINDKFGHAYGDKALLLVVDVLHRELPEGYMVARFGGDEFFVGGMMIDPNQDVDALIERIESSLIREKMRRGYQFPVSVSIGYAKVAPESVQDIERAVVEADKAMYLKKEEHHRMLGQM